jgi:hypothetical protein
LSFQNKEFDEMPNCICRDRQNGPYDAPKEIDMREVRLTLSGPEGDVDRLLQAVSSEGSEFDFSKVIPIPVFEGFDVEKDEDAFMIYDAKYGSDEAVAELWALFKPNLGPPDRQSLITCVVNSSRRRAVELAHQYRLNFERYWHENAQAWRYEHWGTCTPASHIKIRRGRANRAEVTFVTCSYPKPVLSRLAEQFPNVRFDLMVSQFQMEKLVLWPGLEDGHIKSGNDWLTNCAALAPSVHAQGTEKESTGLA